VVGTVSRVHLSVHQRGGGANRADDHPRSDGKLVVRSSELGVRRQKSAEAVVSAKPCPPLVRQVGPKSLVPSPPLEGPGHLLKHEVPNCWWACGGSPRRLLLEVVSWNDPR
jgi:hypothetical protein